MFAETLPTVVVSRGYRLLEKGDDSGHTHRADTGNYCGDMLAG